jgi:membrane protein YdbS with pleckstrin-like domain
MVRTVVAALIFLAVEIAWLTQWREKEALHFLPLIAPLIFIWPGMKALRRQFITVTVSGERMRVETGAVSKSSRLIQLSKVQDVRVDQTMMQRMFGVGNISIETAGEASRLTLEDIDDPHGVASQLLDRAHSGDAHQGSAN